MRSRFKNVKVKVTIDGKEVKFDSKGEYERYLELRKAQEQGIISDLERQVAYELIPRQELKTPRPPKKGKVNWQKAENAVYYFADFVYKDSKGQTVVEDFKGVATPEYILKRKLMKYLYHIEITETHYR